MPSWPPRAAGSRRRRPSRRPTARCAPVVVLGDRRGGEVRTTPGALDGDEHVGELVLDRLERTDRHAELLALLRVLERRVEDRLTRADELERDRGRRSLAAPARRPSRCDRQAFAVADAPDCVERVRSVPSRVEGADRRAASRRRPAPATTWSSTTAGDDVDLAAAQHRDRDRTRPAPRELAGRDLLEPRAAAASASRNSGTNPATVASSGPGAIDAAELLGEDGELGEAETDAAVLLGDRERRPVEPDERVPQPRPASDGSPDTTASTWARTSDVGHSFAEHGADGVAQLFLFCAEVELHQRSRSIVRTSAASARRSSFSIGVSGSASTTTTASGSLYAASWSPANARSSAERRRLGAVAQHDDGDADLAHDVVGHAARPRRPRSPDAWRAPPRPRSGRRCSRRGRTSPCCGRRAAAGRRRRSSRGRRCARSRRR